MNRNLSAWFLVGLIAAVGAVFLYLIKLYIVAIFVAVVLAVLVWPMHHRLEKFLGKRRRIAAAISTVLVLTLIVIPIVATLFMAGSQAVQSGDQIVAWLNDDSGKGLDSAVEKLDSTAWGKALHERYTQLEPDEQKELRDAAGKFASSITAGLYDKTRGVLSSVPTFIVSASIMVLGLYFFLADRSLFVGEFHRMMPLESQEERELTTEFQLVARGVVLGTFSAAIAQTTLAGIAYAVIGIPQIWLLVVLSLVFCFIPFIGSAAVWVSVAAWLIFEGRMGAGIGLAIYGSLIITPTDNLVRAYVIGSQAKLHPFVSLVAVLGGISLIGLWGIFLGPLVAAFLYALLNIARARFVQEKPLTLNDEGDGWADVPAPKPETTPKDIPVDADDKNIAFLFPR